MNVDNKKKLTSNRGKKHLFWHNININRREIGTLAGEGRCTNQREIFHIEQST